MATTLKLVQLLILFNLATLLISTLACPTCPPTKSPPKVKPPPKPPAPKKPPPAIHHPPTIPKTPVKPKPPPAPGTPCPPPPPPPKKQKTPPAPPPKKQETCPIDALKLVACVDVLNSLVHIGIGNNVKDTCCPVLEGLVDLDAALCLCTAIKIKLLNINILIPIALQALVDCGKNPPEGFQCPA